MVSSCYLTPLDPQSEASPTDAKKEDPPKSPSLIAKILAPFKNDKKVKAPKSPKKEKKEEVKVRTSVMVSCSLTDTFVHISLRKPPRPKTPPRLTLLRPRRLRKSRESFYTTSPSLSLRAHGFHRGPTEAPAETCDPEAPKEEAVGLNS
jgi:hypothetical protein